jgi:hypothetical protein
MIGNGRVSVCGGVEPDLVTSSRLSVELESQPLEPAGDVSVPES